MLLLMLRTGCVCQQRPGNPQWCAYLCEYVQVVLSSTFMHLDHSVHDGDVPAIDIKYYDFACTGQGTMANYCSTSCSSPAQDSCTPGVDTEATNCVLVQLC
jgi:hypothetical protein